MKLNLYEELNPQLSRRPEGIKPVKLSSIFSPKDSIENRVVNLDRFFKGYRGFTYRSFHELFTSGLLLRGKKGKTFVNPFRGFTGKFNIEIFGNREVSLEDEKENFDEYVETFFMYLCYQIFIKLFARKDELISQNRDNIERAKKLLSGVSAASMPNIIEGLTDIYTLFYRSLIPSKINFARMSDEDIYEYVEQFANTNINLFTKYPISSSIGNVTVDSPEKLATLIFDACNENAQEVKDSRQLAIIRLVSEMIKGSTFDFDSGALQSNINKNPSLKSIQTQEINFTDKNQAVVNDIIELLYSFNNFSSVDLQWTKNTPWEPLVRFIFAVLCTGELNKSIKEKAKSLSSQNITWQKKLDIKDQDGGVYFINNNALISSFADIPSLQSLKGDFASLISSVASRSSQFQDLSGTALLEAMFAGKYNDSGKLQLIQEIEPQHKEAIKKILHLTDLNFNTLEEAVSMLNRVFLFNDTMPPQYMGSSAITKFDDVLLYAKRNISSFEFSPITKDAIEAFSPTRIWDTITREIPSTISNAFSNFVKTWNFGELGKDLTRDFRFMSAQQGEQSEYFVIKDSNGQILKEIKTPEDLVSYLLPNCLAMGSIICHGKIVFGEETLDKYFNSLTWLIGATERKFGQGNAKGLFGSQQFPILYGVTPFVIEYLKYALRSFANNIHKIEEIDESLRKDLEESHDKSSMEEDEINELTQRAKAAIKSHIEKKMKTLQ